MATANSSNCDLQSPDDVPVILPPDLAAVLAAQNVTDVLLSEVTAPVDITEIVLAMFDRDQLPSLPDHLQPFRGLADPLTVRRAVLTQMRHVADVASVFLARHTPPRTGYSDWCGGNAEDGH